MKTIGLLGGLSWESSREYYRVINEVVAQRLGSVHSADTTTLHALAAVDMALAEV